MLERPLFDARAFARNVRLACADRNLSQRKAAEQAGVSAATFNRVASKEKAPDVETFHRLQLWLGTPGEK